MKAVVYSRQGYPDKLCYCDIDKPVPNDNEVLIKVHSVSLNAADYRSIKMGIIPKRKIFGADIAGVIESAGKNITLFKTGDEVIGDLASYGFGGLAEFVAAPESILVNKPENISFEEGASLPMAAMTALQALRNNENIREGKNILIVGCAGGVGTFAVQLSKYFGFEVTGVCSSKNIQQTISLGADYAIDYTKENFLNNGKRYDIILGTNGNYPLFGYRKALTKNGVFIMIGGALSQIFKQITLGWILSLGSKKMKLLSAKTSKTDLEFLSILLKKGKLKPVIDRIYTLEKTADAMNYLSRGHSTGKVVINIL
jgi:NADPH:quinone reductase-like Zn-dependent oxidoreductase